MNKRRNKSKRKQNISIREIKYLKKTIQKIEKNRKNRKK